MKWGLYDTKDNCWLGDNSGPVIYEDEILAKISSQVTGVRLGYEPNRLVHMEYLGGPKRLRDEVKEKMSAVEALRRIEEGGAL